MLLSSILGLGNWSGAHNRARLVAISNLTYVTIGTFCILVGLVSYEARIAAYIYFALSLISFLMLWVNVKGFLMASRVVFTLTLNLGILISAALCESFYAHAGDRMFFLVNVALASIMFDFKERKVIIPIYSFLLIILVGFDPLREFIASHLAIDPYPAMPGIAIYTKFLLSGVTVALCFLYLQFINSQAQKETLELYEKVRSNNEELQETLDELKSTQGRLVQSNTELKQFAWIVSHDLKAPLRAISTLIDFILTDQKDRMDENGKQQSLLLKSRVSKLNVLIDGIIYYSKVGGRMNKQEIDTKKVVEGVVDMLAPPRHINIEISPNLPVIYADPTRTHQLFQNLLSNAIKFIDKPQGKIVIGFKENPTEWRFSITDNGPGIDEKHKEKIFNIFQTLGNGNDFENTGVGLSIVKKIVEMHDGKVWVESDLGEMTTFHFTIPKTSV